MTRRVSAEWLDEITAVSDQWRRYCNEQPEGGIPINRHGLRVVLAQSDNVAVKDGGVITWTGIAGRFSAEPVATAS